MDYAFVINLVYTNVNSIFKLCECYDDETSIFVNKKT